MSRRRALPLDLPTEGPLARLLAEASAPPQPDELQGLSAALTAFATHQPSRRRLPMKAALTNLLAAKLLIGAVGAASLGGISLAAATDSLPDPAQQVAHDLAGAPAPGNSGAHRQDGTHRKNDKASKNKDGKGKGADDATSDATPSPSLVGLCRAYSAGVADAHGKALDNPAFTVLITAAGGKASVSSYCVTLLASSPGGRPTAKPTHPAQSHQPTTHAPDSHANGHATARP